MMRWVVAILGFLYGLYMGIASYKSVSDQLIGWFGLAWGFPLSLAMVLAMASSYSALATVVYMATREDER